MPFCLIQSLFNFGQCKIFLLLQIKTNYLNSLIELEQQISTHWVNIDARYHILKHSPHSPTSSYLEPFERASGAPYSQCLCCHLSQRSSDHQSSGLDTHTHQWLGWSLEESQSCFFHPCLLSSSNFFPFFPLLFWWWQTTPVSRVHCGIK